MNFGIDKDNSSMGKVLRRPADTASLTLSGYINVTHNI